MSATFLRLLRRGQWFAGGTSTGRSDPVEDGEKLVGHLRADCREAAEP